jgi:glycosyltransferase involved in cell wall biosynthesis
MISFLRYFCNSVEGVISPSRPIHSLLQKWGVETPIEVIPTGIDLQTITPDTKFNIREEYGIVGKTPILLYAGRIGPEKNLPWLISALEEADRQNLPFYCFIVGDGNMRGSIQKLIEKKNLNKKITLTGFLEQKFLAHFYNNCDLFCIPSTTETQCLSAVEAMLKGVPVLGVRAMGLQETVQDGITGILTDPEPEAFTQALLRLLRNESAREGLRQGVLRSPPKTTLNICIERHLQYYQDLIDHRVLNLKKPLKFIPIVAEMFFGDS